MDLGWSRCGARARGTGVLHWESRASADLGRRASSERDLVAAGCEALQDTRVVGITSSLHLGIFNRDVGLGAGTVLPSTHSPCCLPCLMHKSERVNSSPRVCLYIRIMLFQHSGF